MDLPREVWRRQVSGDGRGLHIEIALWSTMEDLLCGSGWPVSLKDAGLAKTEATATAILKVTNLMRTRYAHQVTGMIFSSLFRLAYL